MHATTNQQYDAVMVKDPILNKTIPRTEPSGNNWAAMIANRSGIQSLLPKDGYVDYSDVGPAFKASEAMKNVHEIDPTAILNTLKNGTFQGIHSTFHVHNRHIEKDLRQGQQLVHKKEDWTVCWEVYFQLQPLPNQKHPDGADLLSSIPKLAQVCYHLSWNWPLKVD